MTASKTHSLWYKDAIVYELHVKAFFDSDASGKGDFRGLIQKLDYIQDLGVSAIWLLPFYPSPLRDDGYDISDYRGIHPDYGTFRDFRRFVREAHRRGLKVITELVINHTSDQHPWFQAARRARPGSARRDFYVWSDTDTKFPETRVIFTDTESSNWAWDQLAGAYYWHRFYSHQPDLNLNNPRVVKEVGRVLRFWLGTGVDGLRLDAVPYLCVREGTNNENLEETHAVIRELRRQVDEHFEHKMLLAEANQWPADVRPYFGEGDECHMAFHFPLMPRIFMAIRQEDRQPIIDILDQTPDIPDICQWALFLRNHDELTLEMVTDEERDYMWREYAQELRMRLNWGIRRRLAPLVSNSRRRIELLHSLLFSFPGTPVLYYGDEIGMGDNIYLGDRDGVRTPMQWTSDRNGGFSRADPAKLYLPVIMDPVYGYTAVNVEAQERDPSSLLQFFRRMIALRRQHKAFGRGTIEFLRPRNRKVLVYLRRYRGEVILAVANLSRFAQPVELDLRAFNGWTPLEMFGRTEFPPIGELPYFLTLAPHGFYWFRLEPQSEPLHVSGPSPVDLSGLPVLDLEGGPDHLLGPDFRYTLVSDVALPFIVRQRWYQGKARDVATSSLLDWCKLGAGFYFALFGLEYADGGRETYALPLKLSRRATAERVLAEAPNSVLARIRTPDGEGVIYDALADRHSCVNLFMAMVDGRVTRTEGGVALRGLLTSAYSDARYGERVESVRRMGTEQSNTSIVLDENVILKFYRRVEAGPNPDMEVGRFLTEDTTFRNTAPVLGAVQYGRDSETGTTIVMAQAYERNEGDGWAFFQQRLEAELPALVALGDALPPPPTSSWVERTEQDPPEAFVERARASLDAADLLGRRTAELHRALGSAPRLRRDFAPVPVSPAWLERLANQFATHAREVLEQLNGRLPFLPLAIRDEAHAVISSGSVILHRFEALGDSRTTALRIRVHGDLHLGQVLRLEDDFLLLDFEGEPLRPLAERREKDSPLKDVAGMLRSFAYAAHVAARHLSDEAAVPPESLAAAATWEYWVATAFLRAWRRGTEEAPFVPEAPSDVETLLAAYVADKAFYELRYELNNRPDWVAIPLSHIAAYAGGTRPST